MEAPNNTLHPELLAEIEACCAEREIALSDFGKIVLGDPNFVFDLRNGRDPRTRTVRKVRAFIASQRHAPIAKNAGAT